MVYQYFNTSYVKVHLWVNMREYKGEEHFNTSYVKVHQEKEKTSQQGMLNFNTSYVKVHRYKRFENAKVLSLFQYILC